MSPTGDRPSVYLEHLPPVLRSADLGRFLAAFEEVLTGVGPPDTGTPLTRAAVDRLGLEQLVELLPRYLDPADTPAEFLPWLAGWVGLTLRADWDEARRRAMLARAVPLYRRRGTASGLRETIRILLGDDGPPFEIDDGADLPAHWFEVRVTFGDDATHDERVAALHTVRTVVDLQKPAHTRYRLRAVGPTVRLVTADLAGRDATARRWRLGVADTTLGTAGHPTPAPQAPDPARGAS